MWRNSRLTTPQKRQSDCRRLGHSRLRVASRFTLRIGLASWQTQPPSHAKIAGGPPSLGVHEPSDSPQVTSCHSGTPLCDRPKLTKLSTRALCKLWAEHYWTCPLFLAFLANRIRSVEFGNLFCSILFGASAILAALDSMYNGIRSLCAASGTLTCSVLLPLSVDRDRNPESSNPGGGHHPTDTIQQSPTRRRTVPRLQFEGSSSKRALRILHRMKICF